MSESNRKRRTPAAKLAYWREQVAAWRESGLSRTAYCRRAGVSASSLGHWVRRLAREQDSRDAVPVVLAVFPCACTWANDSRWISPKILPRQYCEGCLMSWPGWSARREHPWSRRESLSGAGDDRHA